MRSVFRDGNLVREQFFNRAGQALLSDGRIHPERPGAVPGEATFEESSDRWALGTNNPETGAPQGLWRWWTEAGVLQEEAELSGGKKVRVRLYDADAHLREETGLGEENVRQGPYYRRYGAADESPYADSRIRQVRGAHEEGHPVGEWTFLDEGGAVLRTVNRGCDAVLRDDDPVFSDEDRSRLAWRALGDDLRRAGRVRAALLAEARAAASAKDAAPLEALLDELTVPLSPAEAERQEAAILDLGPDGRPALLDALVGGVDAATVLRVLASLTQPATRAARDFIETALLLAPGRTMAHASRALIRASLGDRNGALEDAERAGGESPDAAEYLRAYVRVLFPEFSFWPVRLAGELGQTPVEGVPDGPGQPLAAVQSAVGVYATRLAHLRAAIEQKLRESKLDVPSGEAPSWLPPRTEALLPAGSSVALRRETAHIVDETESGPETTEVTIDETLETSGRSFADLMRQARVDWHALSWLCWSVGLDRVAFPEALRPPSEFAFAVAMAFGRCWRAQDALVTGGLRSANAGVPGFTFEGMDIDEMPASFRQMALAEYQDLRAMFLWLMSPENLSPFQSDLREI
jgi:hypothetical protein